jgi:hypothetical protein
MESVFFQIYGSMIALGASGEVKPGLQPETKVNPRELPYVKEALASIEKGGYPEAIARIGALVGRFAGAIPLYRLEMTDEVIRSDEILSKLSENQIRQLRSEAGVMVHLEPERTLEALPQLLTDKKDRERALEVLEWGLTLDGITREQYDMINRIIDLLTATAAFSVKRKPTGEAEPQKKTKARLSKPGEKTTS